MPIIATILIVLILTLVGSFSLTTWAIIGAIVFICVAVLIYTLNFTEAGKNYLKEEAEREAIRKNLHLQEETPSENFVVSHKYILRVNDKIMKGLAVDAANKKVAVHNGGIWRELDWSDVISCDADITENNVTHTTSSRSLLGAAVGGITFGVAGAVVGGIGGKTTSNVSSKIQKIVMRLGFNDIEQPIYEIQFGTVVTEESKREFREWMGRINAILVSNDRSSKATA